MSKQTQLYGVTTADHHQPRSNISRKEPQKNLSRQNGEAQNSQTDTHNSLSVYPTWFTAKLSLVP